MQPPTGSFRVAAARTSTAIGVLRAVHAEPGISRARLAREIGRQPDYRPVTTDGAARAAARIAALL